MYCGIWAYVNVSNPGYVVYSIYVTNYNPIYIVGDYHQYDGVVVPQLKRRLSLKLSKKSKATGVFDKNQEISLCHYFNEMKLSLLNSEFPGNNTIEMVSNWMLHIFNQLFQPKLMDLLPEHENNSDTQQTVHTRTVRDLPEVSLNAAYLVMWCMHM